MGLCLLIGSLCVATVLGEGLVRLAIDVPVTPQMFVSDEVTDFRLKPNVRDRLVWPGDVEFSWTTNSRGYRTTREFAVPKPAATKRVLLLGDSFTFGQGVNDSQTFAAEAQRRLEAACAPTRIDIINTGVPGFSTSQELALLEREGVALQPDVIVLGFYGNDPQDNLTRGVHVLAGDTLAPRPREARPALYRIKRLVDRVPGYAWLAAHSQLVNLIRRTYVAASANNGSTSPPNGGVHAEPGPELGAKAKKGDEYAWHLMRALLSRMRDAARRADSRLMVLLIPDTNDVRSLTSQAEAPATIATPVSEMRSLCRELDLQCLDLAQWMSGSNDGVDEKALFIPGEFHFTVAGNVRAGEFLARQLRSALGCV